MTFLQMKKQVAGYLNRDVAALVVDGEDLLAQAINDAKLWAQREYDFEFCRTRGKIASFDPTSGNDISTMTDLSNNPISVKTFESAWMPTFSGDFFPIEIRSRAYHKERMKDRANLHPNNLKLSPMVGRDNFFYLYRIGGLLYLHPNNAGYTSPFEMQFDVVRWLPQYVNDNDTDFFLNDLADFTRLRTLWQLNLFLKEDQRAPISYRGMEEAWMSVLKWDENLVRQKYDDTDLE